MLSLKPMALLTHQQEDQRNDDAEKDADDYGGSDGKVKCEVILLNVNVPRQPADLEKRDRAAKCKKQPEQNKHYAYKDQEFAHHAERRHNPEISNLKFEISKFKIYRSQAR